MNSITFSVKEEENPGNNTKPLIFHRPIYKLLVSTEYYDMNIDDRLKYLDMLSEWVKKETNTLDTILNR